jgi:hypothetical protein
MEEVRQLMRRRHRLKPEQEDNFYIFSNESATQAFNQISSVVTAASFGVCLLSLIVGGIGILNIMLVSVNERTQEIGVRKALGARRRRILGQFATEAVVLSLFGGVLGVLAGAFIAFLGRWAFGFPTSVPAWAVALAMLMAPGSGWCSASTPRRAARPTPSTPAHRVGPRRFSPASRASVDWKDMPRPPPAPSSSQEAAGSLPRAGARSLSVLRSKAGTEFHRKLKNQQRPNRST